ncbi:MAG: hypothetical protein HUU50_17745 [Candidatus Brocadiae bacterium]|nr:hypothetical protein [Candidatus Brocadiia bacterium]
MTHTKNTIGTKQNRIFTCPHCHEEIPSIIIEQRNRSVFYQYHFANSNWEEMQEIGNASCDIYHCLECDAEISSEELAKQGFDVI